MVRKGGGGGFPGARAEIPLRGAGGAGIWSLWRGLCQELSPKKDPHWGRFNLKDCSSWAGDMLEQGKHMRRKE